MLTLVNDTNSNHEITPEAHGLYWLRLQPNAQIAVGAKPVFGANVTFHSSALKHASFIAKPDNIIGWVDHGGLSHFSILNGPRHEGKECKSTLLPSQFLNVENGILRVLSPMRIYLIATEPVDIHNNGLCFFTPV